MVQDVPKVPCLHGKANYQWVNFKHRDRRKNIERDREKIWKLPMVWNSIVKNHWNFSKYFFHKEGGIKNGKIMNFLCTIFETCPKNEVGHFYEDNVCKKKKKILERLGLEGRGLTGDLVTTTTTTTTFFLIFFPNFFS